MADCGTCGYAVWNGNTHSCDQIVYTDKPRPCPVEDPACPCYITIQDFAMKYGDVINKRREPMARKISFDPVKAEILLRSGKTTKEVAIELNTTYKAIYAWQERRLKQMSNPEPEAAPEPETLPEPDELTEVTASSVERPGMTVGVLRNVLAKAPEDAHILMCFTDYVEGVHFSINYDAAGNETTEVVLN